ncbi:MAG: serine/threonine protein kinase [Acidobacteria bacterium]|nr:MAG: serine/threonine protein kinase [Acidobacteriota bacterium]
MSGTKEIEARLARYVAAREAGNPPPSAAELCADRPQLAERLAEAIRRYEALDETLGFAPAAAARDAAEDGAGPVFDGFRTVERLGSGGMGEVWKLVDLRLGRTVAAKVLRRDRPAALAYGDFLREARALALFQDPRIVQIHEYRPAAGDAPPVLIMEHVDGFALDRIGPSLSFDQRARLLREVCDAIDRAHQLGIQHRDLKPSNVLVDANLRPRVLDFGLAAGDPRRGHGVGTLAYLAPEQLDPSRPIDRRTDVYALGVVLYELLCGERPYDGGSDAEVIAGIRRARPRLPVEVEPRVPEPLQAIALKAMDPDPEARYPTARAMARDLDRYLDRRPVLARPTLYATALARRVRPHLDEIREWLALKLIYPHEARTLRLAYRRLEAREEDWIVESRRLSLAQIALYLGAFLAVCGGLFYFNAHRFHQTVTGLLSPTLALGLPAAGLTAVARWLEGRERRAIAVALYLTGALLLPIYLLILIHELGWWPAGEGAFFAGGEASNRQMQVAALAACLWTFVLARRTHTVALSSAFSAFALLGTLTLLTDFGLRRWLDDGRWDLLAFHLLPLLAFQIVLGRVMERRGRRWLATPLYVSSAGLYVLVLELLSIDGRALAYLGISTDRLQPPEVDDPQRLPAVLAMTASGLLIYAAGAALERRGPPAAEGAAWLLVVASPFALLEPLAWLNLDEGYGRGFLWLYLVLALAIAFASHLRQRKSFYLAGLSNAGLALVLIPQRYSWLERPAWALAVIAAGLLALAAGAAFDQRERRRGRG